MRSLATIVAVVLVVPAGSAWGQSVEDANQAMAELRYDDALRIVESVLHQGKSEPERLRELFALAGQAAGAMGDDAAATLWFRRWVCVEPGAQLAAETSPKLTALLDAARAGLRGSTFRARAVRHEGSPTLEVVIETDPVGLAEGVRADGVAAPLRHGAAVSAVVSSPADQVDVLDHDGNVVVRLEVHVEQATEVVAASRGTRAWWARWPAWTIASGSLLVVSGLGVGVAIDARRKLDDLNEASSSHEFSEALAVERRFDRAQWVARFAVGGAAVAGVVAAVLFVRERGETSRVMVQPTAGGASLTWGGAW